MSSIGLSFADSRRRAVRVLCTQNLGTEDRGQYTTSSSKVRRSYIRMLGFKIKQQKQLFVVEV
jgi:hypothetical protein